LRSIDPSFSGRFKNREEAEAKTVSYRQRMYELFYLMYAESRRSLLIILHGIDASGKDGTVRNIFSGANPQGVRVYSFKQPSAEELSHDYLWRCHKVAPERGSTAIFNRSYYEDVTTVRVHPEYLGDLPRLKGLKPEAIFEQRYKQINHFEEMLYQNNTVVLKFFLHISKDEQKKRLEARLEDTSKNWKFSPDDIRERKFWDEYEAAFNKMLKKTDNKSAPWFVIPANKKWYRDYLVAKTIVQVLEKEKMHWPKTKMKRIKID
jgi:PPK2 family polyphosphate:nucleotide phosphotransferase